MSQDSPWASWIFWPARKRKSIHSVMDLAPQQPLCNSHWCCLVPPQISYRGRCTSPLPRWSCRTLWLRLLCSPGWDQSSIHLRDKQSRRVSGQNQSGRFTSRWLICLIFIIYDLHLGAVFNVSNIGSLLCLCLWTDANGFSSPMSTNLADTVDWIFVLIYVTHPFYFCFLDADKGRKG